MLKVMEKKDTLTSLGFCKHKKPDVRNLQKLFFEDLK